MNFKKTFLITALILAPLLLTANNANANMFNKFKKGFYFEKYKTADEANAALLKLHPIGSNVEELVKTLERVGAKLNSSILKKDLSSNSAREKEHFYKGISDLAVGTDVYEYWSGIPVINPILWKVIIFYDKDELVVNCDLVRHYMGL